MAGQDKDTHRLRKPLRGRSRPPLFELFRRNGRLFPWVVLLGFASSICEGLGAGLLIPLLSLLLSQNLPPATPAAIRDIADVTAGWTIASRATVLGGAVVALFVAKALVQVLNTALQTKLVEQLAHAIRCAVAGKLLKVDYPFLLRQDSARLLNVFYSDAWHLTVWIRSLLSLVSSGIAVGVIALILFWLDVRLSLIVTGCFVLALVAFPFVERRLRALSGEVKATSLTLDSSLEMVLYSQRTLRLFGQEKREEARFAQRSADFRDASERADRFRFSAFPIVDLGMVTLSIVIVLASYRLGLSIAFTAAYLVLLTRGQPYVRQLSDARVNAARYSASSKEVNWLLAVSEDCRHLPGADRPVPDFSQPIEFEAVSYSYPNEGAGIRDASFVLHPGKITALVGPSGAGKSTIVNILTRLLEPQKGVVKLGGTTIADFSFDHWRSRVAVAGQDADLVDDTVAANIAYGRPGASREEIEEVARLAHADRFIAGLPSGYETKVGRGGISLSGGQRQRIGLARALLLRPELLILDEATNAVDGPSEKAILDLLVSHAHFNTALVVSHRESTLAKCEEAIVLDEGTVVEAGPIADLKYLGIGRR
jgi:subfamily B ATP-binding cassette protein MsbA